MYSQLKVQQNKLCTPFCVHNDLCVSSAWLVDSWGVGFGVINQSWAMFVKDIMNSENFYISYLLHVIDIKKLFQAYLIIKRTNLDRNIDE